MPMDFFRPRRLLAALSVVVLLLGLSKPARTVQIEPPPSPELLLRLEPEPFRANYSRGRGVVFLPDGKTLLAASGPSGILQWDIATGKSQSRFEAEDRISMSVLALSQDGKRLISGRSQAVIWDLDAGKQRHRLDGGIYVNAVALSPH